MAENGAVEIGASLSNFALIILDLGNNYFRADAAWKQFPTRIKLLQDTHDDLMKKLEEYGLRKNNLKFLHGAVDEAKKMLEGERSRLEKRKKCCRILCGILFRESVEGYIAAVEGAFGNISTHIERKLQNDGLWRDTALKQTPSLPYATDKRKRYVHLENMEKKICIAIESARHIAVVLLSGEPGSGKSTLAREISLHYAVGSSTIRQVVMVDCGPRVNVVAKKVELLQKLGGVAESAQQSQPDSAEASTSSQDKALQLYLRNPGLLILLDDLWERELVDDLVNLSGSGPGAKYLVTSQRANVCEETNCETMVLPMPYLSTIDAMKILASHAKLKEQKIPLCLLEAAEDIIEQTYRNPLAMAILGDYIAAAGDEKYNLQVWKDVTENVFGRLDKKPRAKVHGVAYKRSYAAAMKASCDALSSQHRNAFVLLGMCGGSVIIPKPALAFLYNTLFPQDNRGGMGFLHLLNDLQSRNLVCENSNGSSLFSVNSLTKRFVLEALKQDVEHNIDLLRNAIEPLQDARANLMLPGAHSVRNSGVHNSSGSMVSALVFQYINVEVQKDIFFGVDVFGIGARDKKAVINSTLELVVKLKPCNAAPAQLDLLGKVLLEFIVQNHLDQDGIVELLTSPYSMLSTLTFLNDLYSNCQTADQSAFRESGIRWSSKGPSIPRSLLDIIQDESCASHHDLASRAFGDLRALFEFEDDDHGVVPLLATLGRRIQNPSVRCNVLEIFAARLYMALSRGHRTIIHEIPDVPGFLSVLGDLLSRDETLIEVKCAVGEALLRLTEAMKSAVLLSESQSEAPAPLQTPKGATTQRSGWSALIFEGLAKCLVQDENIDLQHTAVGVISNIADASDSSGLEELFNHSGLVSLLVHELAMSLLEDQHAAVHSLSQDSFVYVSASRQEVFAKALFHLCRYRAGNRIRLQVSNWLGLYMLEGLAELLAKPACDVYLRHNQHQYAAGAIANLTFESEKESADVIGNHPKLVDSLVKLVFCNGLDDCFMEAARALLNLLYFAEENIRAKNVYFPLLVERLMLSSFKSGGANVYSFLKEQDVSRAMDHHRSLTESFHRMVYNYGRTSASFPIPGNKGVDYDRIDGVTLGTVRNQSNSSSYFGELLFPLNSDKLEPTFLTEVVDFLDAFPDDATLGGLFGVDSGPDEATLGEVLDQFGFVSDLVRLLYEHHGSSSWDKF